MLSALLLVRDRDHSSAAAALIKVEAKSVFMADFTYYIDTK